MELDGVYGAGVPLVLQKAPGALHAPDAGRMIGGGGANDGLSRLGGNLPDAILVAAEFSDHRADHCGRLKAGHNAAGLGLDLVAGLGFAAAGSAA